jgi:hypothetical protein
MQNSTYVISHGALKDGSGYIVLTDFLYWIHYEYELKEWCIKNLSLGKKAFVGSVIEYTSEEELVMFILRWS